MRESIILTGDNLIGDLLMQTPAIRALRQAKPDASIEYQFGQEKGTHVLLEHNPYLDSIRVGPMLMAYLGTPPHPEIPMDAAQAYGWGEANGRTLTEGYGSLLGVDVTDIRYDYTITEEEQVGAYATLDVLSPDRPVVFIARHSASCSSNDDRCGRIANKCVANRYWIQIAEWLLREGYMPVALGGPGEENDPRYREWPGKKLYGQPLREVAALLPLACAVLSVDTGMRHLAAATGTNLYCISGVIPLSLIRCEPVKEGQKIFEERVHLSHVTGTRLIKGAKQVLS
jgi:hypothetical protein